MTGLLLAATALRALAQGADRRVRQLWRAQGGAMAVEYGLIVAGISVAVIVTVFLIGEDLAQMFATIDERIKSARDLLGGFGPN